MGSKRYWIIGVSFAAMLIAPPALAQESETDEETAAEDEAAEEAAEDEEAAEEDASEAEEAEEAAEPDEEAAEPGEEEAEEAAEPGEEGAEEAAEPDEEPEEPEDSPGPGLAPEPEVDPEYQTGPEGAVRVRIYAVTTRNTYEHVRLDVYDAESEQLVASGQTTDRGANERPLSFELPPGLYKIVRAGESFDTRTDFATVRVEPGPPLDYVIVIEPGSQAFRGSGVVTDELPEGVTIAGVRLALNAGGTLSLSHQSDVVGQTSGVHGLYGLFGNFSMVFDRDNHFLDVGSDLELDLLDRPRASVYATRDRFSADALYAYNIQNDFIGPYVRGSFKTSVFPSYLFLDSGIGPDQEESGQISVTREYLDGTSDETIYGTKGTQDNLRVRLADPFSPFILQEEIGANLQALQADLILLDVDIGTRLGWAFRQGLVRDEGLFVAEGDDSGEEVLLREVDSYNTMGPTIGGNATVTFARWLFGSGNIGVIAPIPNREDAGDNFGDRLLVDLSATAGFRVPVLTDLLYATFDYTFRLERDGFLTSDTQIDQNVMGRLNVTLF